MTFVGIAFFDSAADRLRHRSVRGGIGFVVFTVVPGIHEHPEKRRERITKGKKHFTQSGLRAYEDLLYRRKPKKKAE